LQDKQCIKDLANYLRQKSSTQPSLQQLSRLFSDASEAQVGLILTERFVNMPSEIVPPMYKMLLEEIEWAIEDKEPYQFTHYLIVSKAYCEVESRLDVEDSGPKKKKSKAGKGEGETFYFHPEDEILQKHAVGSGSFDYTKQGDEGASDAKRAFHEMGIKPQGHLMLLEAGKFEGAVQAVEQYFNGGGQT